jgi:16S rRNA (guanine(966)-N(2))-methyltransferase RsmD
MPRVVSGSAKGFTLKSVKGLKTRPTADKVKESIFNIIAFNVAGSKFLDLYSGTGQMGIEALSRGGQFAAFVDNDRESLKCIKDNLEKTKLESKSKVLAMNVLSAITSLNGNWKFDIVYIDPPYESAIGSFKKIARAFYENDSLEPKAIVLLEHSANDKPDENVINLKLKKSCKYGAVMVSFYDKEQID